MSRSVVQTKRAVCATRTYVHRVAVDAVALQPGAVVGEVLAHRADQDRAQAELGHAERDVGGHPAPADLEVVDQERQRDLVELLDDELVGEPAREGHQVVGRDRTGDGDLHATTLRRSRRHGAAEPTRCRAPTQACPEAGGGPACGRCAGAAQLNESPQAQELPALGLSMVKPCFSIGVGEVDRRAVEVRGAHPVDDDLDTVEVADDVTVEGALVEVELVDQAGAAAGLHARRAAAGRRGPPARAGS